MNIILCFGPLAFLNIFYTSVQGQVWTLDAAEVGEDNYYYNKVSLERKDDRRTFFLYAIPENSASNVPEVVHGPFELRGFGPYSMLMRKIWLNTEAYVTLTFYNIILALRFYNVLNPYYSPSFPNDFIVKRLVSYSSDGTPTDAFEDYVPKALDIFLLETPTGEDSRARSYVLHNMEGVQEPILIFHSLENEMIVDGDAIELSIYPRNGRKKYRFRIEFEEPSSAQKIQDASTILKLLGCENNLEDLEALPSNTYPSRPPHEPGESSNTGRN